RGSTNLPRSMFLRNWRGCLSPSPAPHSETGMARCRVDEGLSISQVEELQHERVFDLFLGREEIAWLRHRPFAEHRRLVPGEQGPLVELAADLPVELPDRPPAPEGLLLVEAAGVFVLDLFLTVYSSIFLQNRGLRNH